MGFMDKAKKLAEQAQQKIDETQKQFNESQSGDKPEGAEVRYDEHGRPIPDSQPAPSTPPAPGEAASPPEPGQQPGSDSSAAPDPFKPL